MAVCQLFHYGSGLRGCRVITLGIKYETDCLGGLCHVILRESARRHGRRAESDTARDIRSVRIAHNSVLVRGDVRVVEPILCVLACQTLFNEIHQQQMIVRAARHKLVS